MEGGKEDLEHKSFEEDELEEEEKVDPLTLAPDLFDACKANDTEKIRKFIDDGVPFTHIDPDNGWSCLHWAACHGNVQAVKALLKVGAARDYQVAAQNVRNYMENEEPEEAVTNTPLHWAAYKGRIRTVWVLLQEGYSPNDIDEMGNTPVHLSASGGHDQILRILLDDGGNPHAKNKFRNTPLEVAVTDVGKKMLDEAMEQPVPSRKQMEEMHRKNLEVFLVVEQHLRQTMTEVQDTASGMGLMERVALLRKDIEAAEDMAVDTELIEDAQEIVDGLLLQEELRVQIEKVQKDEPIITQTQYTDLVNPLSNLLAKGEERNLAPTMCATAKFLVQKSHCEYWLKVALNRLQTVDCATEDHVRDMSRLKEAIQKADASEGEKELVAEAMARHAKLTSELEITRSMGGFPEVRVPIEEAPKDYYQPSDVGHIMVDDHYPLPPPDTGEYVWIPSESLKSFRAAHDRLAAAVEKGGLAQANQDAIAQGEEKLKESNEVLKKLVVKDDEDFLAAKAVAEKAAKKLKKKKKGKKKK
mmetsp:Transcript_13271/g.17494  ORF Transcript_13271/g.17494 Transcript_13271/m.17494 type:complete len:529 (-) Transcript_13271:993-2579(-)